MHVCHVSRDSSKAFVTEAEQPHDCGSKQIPCMMSRGPKGRLVGWLQTEWAQGQVGGVATEAEWNHEQAAAGHPPC